MNLRQPYEQLIADKLRKLPAPDADASWQQMKRLLDEDEDTRAGGGKRPPGSKGWWRIGIIALLLTTSLWLYVEKTKPPVSELAKNNTTNTDNTAETKNSSAANKNNTGNNKTSAIDNTTTLSSSASNTNSAENKKSANTGVDNNSITAATTNNAPVANSGNGITPAGSKELPGGDASVKTANSPVLKEINPANKPIAKEGSAYKNAAGSNKTNTAVLSRENLSNIATGNDNIAASHTNSFANGSLAAASPKHSGRQYGGKAKNNPGRAGDRYKEENDDKTASVAGNYDVPAAPANGNYAPAEQPVAAREINWFERLNELKTNGTVPSYNTSLMTSDNIESRSAVNNLINSENKKLAAKLQREKAAEELAKKEKRSLHLNLSNVFKPFSLHIDEEPRWAAGIALNSGLTVNAQSRFNYNMNAKSGTLSDYIPSPYVQFHLNNYVYMQTELNFITPQYTPQLLVYQQSSQLAQPGMSQQKSIYIQKLYYFNLPLSLHYSPINNLYLAGGIQFSSFQSGLVSIQEKQYDTQSGPSTFSSVNNTVLKFKDDSIAAKLAPNEWRWQTGADYYWNRFTIGARYNKSFKDLLNVNVSGSLPATTTRNASFILFMRYNLFESKKKDNSEQQRSLTRF